MKPHVRRAVNCVTLLVLTGTYFHIDRYISKASADTAPTGQQVAYWSGAYTSYAGAQSTSVNATIRTFSDTHPDFSIAYGSVVPGRYQGIMSDTLTNGKPALASTGHRVLSDWRDAAGNAIEKPRSYTAAKTGDLAGSLDSANGGVVTSSSTFTQWFNDTAGVNSSSTTAIGLTKQGADYVFDGSLDAAAGGKKSYTAEAQWDFVYQASSNFFIDLSSNAEAWLYIDGQLVIDGGGIAGIKFNLSNGTIVTQEVCDATITVVGAAIQSGSTPCPVTCQAKVGSSTLQPFGSFSSPTAGNVNTPTGNPRTASLGKSIPANTVISVTGESWKPSSTTSIMTVDASTGSANAVLLRNGDAAPNIKAFQNQASAKAYLAPYINATTNRIMLQANQAIYLFELGTTNLTSTAADFQDLVVLVTMTPPAGASGSSASSSGAPDLHQRIDLSRIPGLDDKSSHKIKLLFANRTGGPSTLKIDTNINTLNLANFRTAVAED